MGSYAGAGARTRTSAPPQKQNGSHPCRGGCREWAAVPFHPSMAVLLLWRRNTEHAPPHILTYPHAIIFRFRIPPPSLSLPPHRRGREWLAKPGSAHVSTYRHAHTRAHEAPLGTRAVIDIRCHQRGLWVCWNRRGLCWSWGGVARAIHPGDPMRCSRPVPHRSASILHLPTSFPW